jgi:glucose/arabinose dehydrogenase
MLRRTVALLCAAPSFLLIAQIAACGSDSPDAATSVTPPGPDGSTPAKDGGPSSSDPDTGAPEVHPPPTPQTEAKGDPCRGQPLPEDQHYVPAGLCARLVATGTSGLRQITFALNGDMIGQSTSGNIFVFRDADDDGFYTKSEIHLWGTTGSNGNNADLDAAGGYIYAGFDTGVKRFKYDPNSLVAAGPAENIVVNQPSGGSHPRHTVHVYDGFLYVHSGSNNNVTHEGGNGQSTYDTKRALIKRFDLSKFSGQAFDWSTGEVVTVGLRNANGFKRNEATKKIYAVVNGIDDATYAGNNVHNDNPGEQVVEIAKDKQYGYPFCFTAQRISGVDPGTQLKNVAYTGNPADDNWCAQNSSKPTTFVQAHSAPLDLAFFDNQPHGALPEKWRGGAFIAFHGSWDRDPATGYKVVWQPFNADGSSPMPTGAADSTTFPYEVVFGRGTVAGGPADGAWAWSDQSAGEAPRPAGVAVNPIDGALYIASDIGGLVYRIGVQKK